MDKSNKKKMFRFFVYGYLNDKFITVNRIGKEVNYKSVKINAAKDYLKLGRYSNLIQSIIIVLLRFSELPLSLIFLTVSCIKYLYAKQRQKDRGVDVKGEICFFVKEPKMDTLLKNAHFKGDDCLMVTYPHESLLPLFHKYRKCELINSITSKEILEIYYYSLLFSCFFYFKYRKSDTLFRVYSCFDFFITMLFIEKMDNSNSILCTETFSRWAYMMSDQKHKKIFLQHGMIGDGIHFLKKVGNPDVGYFINDNQKRNCCVSLFTNVPESHIMDGLTFSNDDILLKNGKTNILIVCRYSEFEKETMIARIITKAGDYNLYLKPHPLHSRDKYENLAKELGFVLLEKNAYPKVDVVISYKSTLALEYADAGIEVIRHDEVGINEIIKVVKSIDKNRRKPPVLAF